MKHWKDTLISPSDSIRKALEAMESAAMQIALVVDERLRLLGTITDGDVRRGILRGVSLDEPAERVMNSLPTVARSYEDPKTILAVMKLMQLHQIPLVDEEGKVLGIEILEDLIQVRERDNWVVLMAGGLGTRLAPLTDDCPKPLLKVGGRPLLETIIDGFIEQGFRRFYLSVNYKAEMVKEYFGDGSRWGIEIRYLHETQALGTAGALSLLSETPTLPILVMNGDLLTKVNYRQLLDFHAEQHADATMCIREYKFQVPYGVVKTNRYQLLGIDEKPEQRFFVSAGIYVFSPQVLEHVVPGEVLNMPAYFQGLVDQRYHVTTFPIREYWLDIGQMDDFKRAHGDYLDVFK